MIKVGSYVNLIRPPIERNLYKAGLLRCSRDLEDLSNYRNAFTGKRCFIMGNGPSLNQIDLSKLQNEYVFVFNGAYELAQKFQFAKPFYLIEDHLVAIDHSSNFKNLNRPKFIAHDLIKHFNYTKSITTVYLERNYRYNSRWPGFLDKSTNYPIFYWGGTVAYFGLQMADFMNFDEIIFIGMDLSYIVPNSVIKNGTQLTSTEDDPNHYSPNYFGVGKRWHIPETSRMLKSFKCSSSYPVVKKVINATVGGNLDCFTRKDYNDLF